MPTPARTSLDEIVGAGRAIVESDGLDALTMQAVATKVGVRAPSLYKRVRSRADLVRLIVEDAARELAEIVEAAVGTGDPRHDLRALANAFRSFAHAHPGAYGLLFARLPEGSEPNPELLARSSAVVLSTTSALSGPDRALEAARTVVAWAHGFLSMELAGAFRLGGDVDAAYEFGIERLGAALTRPSDEEHDRHSIT